MTKEEKAIAAREQHIQEQFDEIYDNTDLSEDAIRYRKGMFRLAFLLGYTYFQDLGIKEMEDRIYDLSENNTSTSESE